MVRGPSLRSNLSFIYSGGPGPLPLSFQREGIPQRPISKGGRGTYFPCPKVVFAYKVGASVAGAGSVMTSVLSVGGQGLVGPEWKPLEYALGTCIRPCPLCTKGENCSVLLSIARLSFLSVILDS